MNDQNTFSATDHNSDANLRQGTALFRNGNYAGAMKCFERVLAVDADHVDALNNKAGLLLISGQIALARMCLEKVLAIDPNHVTALDNLGAALEKLGEFDAALACYQKVLSLIPQHSLARCNLARVFLKLDRYQEAIACVVGIQVVDPKYLEALNSCALASMLLGRDQDALRYLDDGLKISPNNPNLIYLRSLIYLAEGNFDDGFREFQSRWSTVPMQRFVVKSASALWLGTESLAGKSILLYHEQGYGDTIQFVRYVGLVNQLGARVYLFVRPPQLRVLLESFSGDHQLLLEDDPLPPHDFRCPLMSLPLAFRTRLGTIPARVPYLHADAQRVAKWQHRLGPQRKLRVGLVWCGHQEVKQPSRDIKFKLFNDLFSLDADFISLQKDPCHQDKVTLGDFSNLRDFGESLTDFADTAALISNVDLIISVDTATAHVAGALGKPVWVLLRYAPCWRWPRNRSNSSWYPTARLFRQQTPGSWESVIAEVRVALTSLISGEQGASTA